MAFSTSNFVITNDNKLYACGRNTSGQLGLGNDLLFYNELALVTNLPAQKNVFKVTGGASFSILSMNDGTIYACGDNSSGQLGLGDNTNRNIFSELTMPEGINAKLIVCGGEHLVILTHDNTVYGCGNNNSGQLGLGDNINRNYLTQLNLPEGKTPLQIACGYSFTSILMTDGTIYVTGRNNLGQLGLGNQINVNTFTLISNIPAEKTPQQVFCGDEFLIVWMDDNTFYGAGDNRNGQFGMGHDPEFTTSLIQIFSTMPNDKSIAQIVCGAKFNFILFTDNTAYGTGNNGFGELGMPRNTEIPKSFNLLPNVPPDKTISKISLLSGSSLFLMTDGTVYGTGKNGNGQLAVGTNVGFSTLTQIIKIPNTNNYINNANSLMDESIFLEFISPTLSNFSIPVQFFVNDQPFQIEITQPMSNSSGSFSYTSSNPLVATVSGNMLNILGPGMSIITAIQAASANYSEASIQTTLYALQNGPLNISNGFELSYYTNISQYTYLNLINQNIIVNDNLISKTYKIITTSNDNTNIIKE